MLKVEATKKKALEDNLQMFLKNEGYGEIPKHILEGSYPPEVSNVTNETDEALASRGHTPVIEESPTERILTKGVALWMGGVAQILTGPRQDFGPGIQNMRSMKQQQQQASCQSTQV